MELPLFCNSFRLFFSFGEIDNSVLPIPVELNNLSDEKDSLNEYEKLNKYCIYVIFQQIQRLGNRISLQKENILCFSIHR